MIYNILLLYIATNIFCPLILMGFAAYDTKKEFWISIIVPGGALFLILKWFLLMAKQEIITQYKKLK